MKPEPELSVHRAPDLTSHLLSMLNEFVYQLVCSGQLTMAKSLRIKILEKVSGDLCCLMPTVY